MNHRWALIGVSRYVSPLYTSVVRYEGVVGIEGVKWKLHRSRGVSLLLVGACSEMERKHFIQFDSISFALVRKGSDVLVSLWPSSSVKVHASCTEAQHWV